MPQSRVWGAVLAREILSFCRSRPRVTLINSREAYVTKTVDIKLFTFFLVTFYVFNVFSERELMFMFAICRRPSVCLSVVCLSVCRL